MTITATEAKEKPKGTQPAPPAVPAKAKRMEDTIVVSIMQPKTTVDKGEAQVFAQNQKLMRPPPQQTAHPGPPTSQHIDAE